MLLHNSLGLRGLVNVVHSLDHPIALSGVENKIKRNVTWVQKMLESVCIRDSLKSVAVLVPAMVDLEDLVVCRSRSDLLLPTFEL